MSIPPISADLQAYFCQYGIPTGCHLSLLSSPTFDWATVNPPPQLDFGRPLWATNGATGHVAQHESSSGMQGRVTRSMAQDDDIREQMSLHSDSQLPPPAPIMSGTTAKRKAPLDETDTRTVRRSNGVRTTRENVHAAEAEAAEGLPLVPQMLAEAKVAQSNTSKFNNGYQEDYFHMVHPFVQVVPASVAGPSHQWQGSTHRGRSREGEKPRRGRRVRVRKARLAVSGLLACRPRTRRRGRRRAPEQVHRGANHLETDHGFASFIKPSSGAHTISPDTIRPCTKGLVAPFNASVGLSCVARMRLRGTSAVLGPALSACDDDESP